MTAVLPKHKNFSSPVLYVSGCPTPQRGSLRLYAWLLVSSSTKVAGMTTSRGTKQGRGAPVVLATTSTLLATTSSDASRPANRGQHTMSGSFAVAPLLSLQPILTFNGTPSIGRRSVLSSNPFRWTYYWVFGWSRSCSKPEDPSRGDPVHDLSAIPSPPPIAKNQVRLEAQLHR